MRSIRTAALLALLIAPVSAQAQGGAAPPDFKAEWLRQFEASVQKIQALAEAMPADKYTWSPGEGVMPVGQVYMHIAHYNYLYPSENLGVALPAGVQLATMEQERDKQTVLRALRQSVAYARAAAERMEDADLARQTRLYGRDVPSWSVLLQLVAHMNEHLGQSIAYARMNGVVPPWSR
jgi:uncharacterized damage-inducible protein DinB